MQTHTTNTNSTTNTSDTTITADQTKGAMPTIAQLIAERDARIAAEAAERKQQEEARAQAWAHQQHKSLCQYISEKLPAELRNALAPFTIRWIENTGGLTTLTGTHAVAVFTYNGEEWAIDTCNGLDLTGPNGYRWHLSYYDIQEDILFGLQHYPEWLAEKEAEAQREAEYQAYLAREAEAEAAAKEPEQPQRYTGTEGNNARSHLLHPGARICVSYARYYGEDGAALWGTVEAFDKHSILLNLMSGSQILINRQHVESIEPLYPTSTPAPKPHEQPQHNPDMMSEEIPF